MGKPLDLSCSMPRRRNLPGPAAQMVNEDDRIRYLPTDKSKILISKKASLIIQHFLLKFAQKNLSLFLLQFATLMVSEDDRIPLPTHLEK
jgi:hypothetical protein